MVNNTLCCCCRCCCCCCCFVLFCCRFGGCGGGGGGGGNEQLLLVCQSKIICLFQYLLLAHRHSSNFKNTPLWRIWSVNQAPISTKLLTEWSVMAVSRPLHFLQFVSVLHPTRHEYRLLAFNRWVSFTFPARMQHSVGATAQLMQHFRHIYCAQGSLLKANLFVPVFKGS